MPLLPGHLTLRLADQHVSDMTRYRRRQEIYVRAAGGAKLMSEISRSAHKWLRNEMNKLEDKEKQYMMYKHQFFRHAKKLRARVNCTTVVESQSWMSKLAEGLEILVVEHGRKLKDLELEWLEFDIKANECESRIKIEKEEEEATLENLKRCIREDKENAEDYQDLFEVAW